MKIHKKIMAAFAALLIMLNSIPVSALDTPAFYAEIEYTPQNYIVRGTFTEFTPDTSSVQPLYSLDGKNYQVCGENWDLRRLGTEDEDLLATLQNQTFLFSNQEPLKSYLAEKLDCFYLKLRITRENGITYETQPSVIDRGVPQPIPEGLIPGARFSPDMTVTEKKPFRYYGRYQLTISENATAEEISSYLPDTLPVKIELQTKNGAFTDGIVNCPITWKPLSLPQLTAGESVTIADAAEDIVVPEGTLVTTPTGIYQLDEPLRIDQYAPADEVRLVINVISEGEDPTGVLSEENAGLEMAFQLKPTGATKIRAYTFREGDSEWTEIPDLPLSEAVNAQPSTKNSDYTLMLDNTSEPYRSYLEAQTAGDTPTPFFIGLKIEGGVYNGKQLILAWPAPYESPVKLPDIGGSGGNQNNAGASNSNDSAESGQRPNLPQTRETEPQATATPDDTTKEQPMDLPKNPISESKTEGEPDIPDNKFHFEIPFRAEINAEDGYPDSKINAKTDSMAELTASASLQSETQLSDAPDSPDTEENTNNREIPDRTTESKQQKSLLLMALIAAAGLCITVIYFAASYGKISEKSHIFRRFLLHR